MAASLIMASTKAMIPLLTQDRPIAEALAELNRRLASQLGRKEFVALLLAAYEPREGRLVLSNAGLPDPYLLSPGGRLRSLEVPGPRYPLGIRSEIAYRSLELSVGRGERVLFFTDGLPEASVAPGEPLGYERLAEILALSQSTGGDWLDGFVSEVEDATRSEREDDWTVLLLERELESSVAR
jgi:sigma-B regulation protein RsbU (phosphoserine phosphatase)